MLDWRDSVSFMREDNNHKSVVKNQQLKEVIEMENDLNWGFEKKSGKQTRILFDWPTGC